MSSFIEKCLAREVKYGDIDDFIDQWHQDPQGKQLYGFLGMTRREYELWVAEDALLPIIVSAHEQNKSLDEIIEDSAHQLPIAAKSPGPGKTRALIDWLMTWKPSRQPTAK